MHVTPNNYTVVQAKGSEHISMLLRHVHLNAIELHGNIRYATERHAYTTLSPEPTQPNPSDKRQLTEL